MANTTRADTFRDRWINPVRLAWVPLGMPTSQSMNPGIAATSGPPLGAPSGWSFMVDSEQLHPGTSVLLFTDGLIERRDASLDDGFRWLSELCRAELSPEKRCDAIVDKLTANGELDDDVAFLVIEVARAGSTG